MALDLIRDAEGDCVGVIALEMETGEVCMILHAKAVFRHRRRRPHLPGSTNAFINTGDGLGMAARAGIPLEDMEFWQFHPTGVAGAGVLITEGVRGEGGILRNKQRRALHGALRAERSRTWRRATSCRARWTRRSRKVAAAVRTRTTCCSTSTHLGRHHHEAPAGHPRDRDQVRQRRPIKEPIPVVPTIHYQMGGIPTNYQRPGGDAARTATRTGVNGLYAVGECACVSVHGANRLGTNSLLDLVVFGRAAGATSSQDFNLPEPRAQAAAGRRRRRTLARLAASTARPAASTPRTWPTTCAHDAGALRRVPHPGLLNEGVSKMAAIREASSAKRPDQGQEQGLQHRPCRGARARQPDRGGQGDHRLGRGPQGEPRRACPPRFPQPRRRELDQAHPLVLRRQRAWTTSR
jgi:succinate dehydrogenase / fumarate reductase flavoprotein subunit